MGEVMRAGWLRALWWWIIPLMALGVVLVLVEYTFFPTTTSILFAGILEGLILATTVAVLGIFFIWVRSVDFSDSGLTFIIGFRKVEVSWHDLLPPTSPVIMGTIPFKYRRNGQVQTSDGLAVSKKLARAILADPRCPRFGLDSRIWKSLGGAPSN